MAACEWRRVSTQEVQMECSLGGLEEALVPLREGAAVDGSRGVGGAAACGTVGGGAGNHVLARGRDHADRGIRVAAVRDADAVEGLTERVVLLLQAKNRLGL